MRASSPAPRSTCCVETPTTRALVLISILSLTFMGSTAGCDPGGESDGGVGDSGVDSAAPDGGPAPPEVPLLPSFTPCPDGWRAIPTGEGFEVCDPYPEGGRPTCGRDEGFWPGATECAPIGTPCPSGDFPVDLPFGSPILYVLAGASGGDGTEASPFGAISDATAIATPGTTIAVGKGTYSEEVRVPTGVALHGACVAETVITFDDETYLEGTIQPTGADVSIRNLRVANSARVGIAVIGEGMSATIEDVVVHDCYAAGISVEMGGSLEAARIVSRDHRPIEAFNAGGRGLSVETGADASVRWLHVEGCREYGVLVFGAELDLQDASIVDMSPATPSALVGLGFLASEGGQLSARRIVVEEATTAGTITQNTSTLASYEDLVVRRTRSGGRFGEGRGMEANDFSEVSCTRCLFEDLMEVGVGVSGGSRGSLTDTLIRRVEPRPADDRSGRAMTAQNQSSLSVERVVGMDVREHGIVVDGMGSEIRGTDLIIRRVEAEAYLDLYGRGFTLQGEATADLTRLEISEVREVAIITGEGATASLTDLYVHDIRPRLADDYFGRGISAQSSMTLNRARVERVFDLAVGALGEGVRLTATDLLVSDVQPQRCDEGVDCVEAPGGHGVGSYQGARATVMSFGVNGAELCGVQVADEATIMLEGGVISGSEIGACLQSDQQDVEDLQRDVLYEGNETNLQATMLPVPAPLGSVD